MADTSKLFREQAIDAARDRLGDPSKLYGVKGWLLTGFLFVSLVTCGIYISTGHYARRETVAGAIMPGAGVERASSLRGGTVKQVLVKNGQHVKRGQPLFLMSFGQILQNGENLAYRLDATAQNQLASIEQQSSLKKRQINAQQQELRARVDGLQDDIRHLTQQETLQSDRVELLEKDYSASAQLLERDYISRVQLMQKHDALLQGQQALLQIKQNISERHSQIEQFRAELRAGEAALAQADADLGFSRAQYDEKLLNNLATDGSQIMAMRDGNVTNRLADIVLNAKEEGIDKFEACTPDIQGHIKISDLSFRYTPYDPLVFCGLNLTVRAGEFLAITGPSGVGKSSLLKVICGLYSPSSGNVSIDGRSTTAWGPKALRSQLGIVMQDDELLSGTISDNVTFFDEKLDIDRVWKALKDASLYDDVMAMPMKADTFVGDMGSALSGGQKQRLLIARALYRRPAILLMDEATSHLDVRNETAINRALKTLEITRVVFAHRIETLRAADKVYDMASGKFIEKDFLAPTYEHT
jgi:ABC-type multidrug transport system fused ATPase/permease subunit